MDYFLKICAYLFGVFSSDIVIFAAFGGKLTLYKWIARLLGWNFNGWLRQSLFIEVYDT